MYSRIYVCDTLPVDANQSATFCRSIGPSIFNDSLFAIGICITVAAGS